MYGDFRDSATCGSHRHGVQDQSAAWEETPGACACLDGSRSPGDELGQLAFPDALQALVHLRRVDLALDDVEDRDVAALLPVLPSAGDHPILLLQQPSHHVKDGRLPHSACVLVERHRRVSRHEEVAARRRYKRRYQPDHVVVHVPRVAQGRCAGRHHSGHLASQQRAVRAAEAEREAGRSCGAPAS